MKILIILLFMLKISLIANSVYYKHRVSQFELLSNQSSKNIVMLGDSITDRGLWNELINRDDIINRGISGDTTIGVLSRVDSLNKSLKQAFVMIGTNDILKGRSVGYVFKNYKKIMALLQKQDIVPIVQSNLYVGNIAPAIYNQRIEELNTLLSKYCFKNKIQYIDLNKEFAPDKVLLDKYSLDGLHLNGIAYIKWAKIIAKYMQD